MADESVFGVFWFLVSSRRGSGVEFLSKQESKPPDRYKQTVLSPEYL